MCGGPVTSSQIVVHTCTTRTVTAQHAPRAAAREWHPERRDGPPRPTTRGPEPRPRTAPRRPPAPARRHLPTRTPSVPSARDPEQQTPRYRTTFVRLLRFLGPYKVSLVVSILLAIGSQSAALAFPWLTGNVVKAIRDDDRDQLEWLIAAVLASALRGR